MRKRFCPKCGVTITEGVLCSSCSKKELPIFEIPLIQVSEFQRVFTKGVWKQFRDLEELIILRVKEVVGKQVPIKVEPFEFIPRNKKKIILHVIATINEQKVRIPVKLSYRQCDFGQKQKTEYYQGILQLRNPHKDALAFLEADLAKVAHKGVFVVKVADTKYGKDLYFTDKSYLRILANKLLNKFGGTVSLNEQLFSHNHQTSKDIFRLNALVTLPSFQVNDTISTRLVHARTKNPLIQYFKILKMGKLIQGKNLMTGKQVGFELKYATELQKIEKQKTRILSTNPELLIMDPVTFQGEIPGNNNVLTKKYASDELIFIIPSKKGLLIVE